MTASDHMQVVAKDIEKVIKSLEESSNILFEWFSNNLMKSNAVKCHLLVSTSNKVNIRIDNIFDVCSKCAKLLAVKSIINSLLMTIFLSYERTL